MKLSEDLDNKLLGIDPAIWSAILSGQRIKSPKQNSGILESELIFLGLTVKGNPNIQITKSREGGFEFKKLDEPFQPTISKSLEEICREYGADNLLLSFRSAKIKMAQLKFDIEPYELQGLDSEEVVIPSRTAAPKIEPAEALVKQTTEAIESSVKPTKSAPTPEPDPVGDKIRTEFSAQARANWSLEDS